MMGIQPIVREKSLAENVYEQLKHGLTTGEFTPGEKLTVRGLAEAANVSFTPAREAISRLITEGVLSNLGPKTVIVPRLTPDDLREITRIRQSLECLATVEAAANLSKDDLVALSNVQDSLERSMESSDFRAVLEANEEFHFSIYHKSNMPWLVQMIELCWLRIGPSLNLLYPEFSVSRSGIKTHRAILKALQKNQHDHAGELIRTDIEAGYRSLSRLID